MKFSLLNQKLENAIIHWNDSGAPISEQFDDIYSSDINGLDETRHVFLRANALPNRWHNFAQDHFVIAETGFGTGLNFLAAWQCFNQFKAQHAKKGPKRLYFTSFEKYPLTLDDLSLALTRWPELAQYAQQLLAHYPSAMSGCHRISLQQGEVILDLWFGDLHDSLPQLHCPSNGLVDCWFLDGFAPSKNPDMWSPDLFNAMAYLAKPNATVATFTAAGFVRRGLIDAGFAMSKVKGFGRKREMIAGELAASPVRAPEPPFSRRDAPTLEKKAATIIGGGIASAATALAMVNKGWQVTLFCKDSALAQDASGNRQGALYPLLSPNNAVNSALFSHAFEFSCQTLKNLSHHDIAHDFCGVVEVAYNEKSAKKINGIIAADYPASLVTPLDDEQMKQAIGLEVKAPGLIYPNGGWLSPGDLTRAMVQEAQTRGQLTVHFNAQAKDIKPHLGGWQFSYRDQQHFTPLLIIASGANQLGFAPLEQLPIFPVRGQVSHVPANQQTQQLKTVLCYQGYLTPAHNNAHCIGASYGRNESGRAFCAAEHQENHTKIISSLAQVDWPQTLDFSAQDARVGVRCGTRDNLPFVGGVPIYERFSQYDPQHQSSACYENLYMIGAMGSRGLCTAPLMAELLASELSGEPLPVSQTILKLVHPNRYWQRSLKKGRPL